MPLRIGLIGKTNTGKTTFFNSATLQSQEISTYPFTTKAPNTGTAQVLTLCVHRELGVEDNPRNSSCTEGWRRIPVELIDLPGLIKDAWKGKGLGNQFLSVASQSHVLLHIVDASGGVDAEGRITQHGEGDPLADIGDIEEELVMWYLKLLEGHREKISRNVKGKKSLTEAMLEVYRGIGVSEDHIDGALQESGLKDKALDDWSMEESKKFSWILRDVSKPTLILANKMDLPDAAENFDRIREEYSDLIVVPASAEAELTLRKAESQGLIHYVAGEERFEIPDKSKLNAEQGKALSHIRKMTLGEYMRTGIQFALNIAVFKLLRMNAVYPVYDHAKMTDRHGNVLPDVHLLPSGSDVEDLAKDVHTDLAKGLLHAVDARNGLRLPSDYQLNDRDVLSIVSASKKGK